MSYWKWLKGAVSWGSIKDTLKRPYAEYTCGLIAGCAFLGSGLALGTGYNRLYFVLFLGIIPSILIALHGYYRAEMRRRGRPEAQKRRS